MLEILRWEFSFFSFYFLFLLSQIAGFWIFGMVAGSLVSVFGKNKLHSVFVSMRDKELGLFGLIPAAFIGILSPICTYGTIPIAAAFAKKGMAEDWIAAFMVSSILLNPQLLFYTAVLGRVAFVLRFAFAFFLGIAAGLLVHFFFKKKNFFNFKNFDEIQNRDTDPNILLRFLKNLWRNLKVTSLPFFLGITIAVLFQRFVPPEAVGLLFGRYHGFGHLMAVAIGVPFYFCGGATIPLLMDWLASGMSLGIAVTFMIAGQAMKIINLGALKIVLGAKHFLFYVLFCVAFSVLCGVLVDAIGIDRGVIRPWAVF